MRLVLKIFLTIGIFHSISLAGINLAQASDQVVPGQFPPKEIQQKVRPLLKEIRVAQVAKNEKRVLNLAQQIIRHLGPWAANPQHAPNYFSPINPAAPNAQEVALLWKKISPKMKTNALWVVVPDGDPKQMSYGLRQAARPLLASIAVNNSALKDNSNLVEFITKGADYLVKLQRKNGLFPAPDLRGDDQIYTSFNKRTLKKNPDALVEGWFEDDHRGELQLDHAVSAIAMLKAFQLTKEQKYLKSAIAAADWAIAKELDTNWSYNSYSAWLLAEVYQQTGQPKYLFHAVEKIRLGVLPGLLDSGRWFDPINARLLYHAANVRGMLAVYRNLPAENDFKAVLKQHIIRALDNASKQINSNGASSTTTSTEMLIEGLRELGEKAEWRTALNININAAIESADNGDANIGLFLPSYIEFAFVNKS